MFRKCLGLLKRGLINPFPVRVRGHGKQPRGPALLSYLSEPCLSRFSGTEPYFSGHSNKWESREIARVLAAFGYDVDVIDWTDGRFTPKRDYALVMDIHKNLQRIANPQSRDQIKIMHLTGSYPRYHNAAELRRIDAVHRRRGVVLQPRRLVVDVPLMERSLEIADACTLIGNSHTLSTFPLTVQPKIQLVPVSASPGVKCKTRSQFTPRERHFLWFFGAGAVHKGLDLLLEVFSAEPSWNLHVVGNIESELDFLAAYDSELKTRRNISYHGYVLPNTDTFTSIASKCFSFIGPSCSEAISAAAVTCMQIGLFPIVSPDTGIDLPYGCGRLLNESTHEELRDAVAYSLSLTDDELQDQIAKCQMMALTTYSRENFALRMQTAIQRVLETHAR